MGRPRKNKKPPAPKMPPILAAEQEQIRIRRAQDFPIARDEFGRERVPATADGQRTYDKSPTGIVRLRLADPLKELKLSPRQRNAGLRFREDFEIATRDGMKPVSFDIKVDISGTPKGIPAALLDAWKALQTAKDAIRHPQIVSVVEQVCGLRMSIREIAQAEPRMTPRPALTVLLCVGLDYLADHYYGPVKKRA